MNIDFDDPVIEDFEERASVVAEALYLRGFYALVWGMRESEEDDPFDAPDRFQMFITDNANNTVTLTFPYPNSGAVVPKWPRHFEPDKQDEMSEVAQFVQWLADHFKGMGLTVISVENATIVVQDLAIPTPITHTLKF